MPSDDSVPDYASLVIAVTGHSDLDPAEDSYKVEIGNIFTSLRGKYPNTPLLLLSDLAEGAGRIAVNAAREANIRYIAVLPMPADLYRNKFSGAALVDFNDRLKCAWRCIELPPAGNATSEDDPLSQFLVKYSQILIAIWDQDRASTQDRTSRIVAMKLREDASSGRLAFARMNANGAGPVYVLPARRIGSGAGAGPALKCEVRYPEGSVPEDYAASYRLLDRFNADIAQAGDDLHKAEDKSQHDLFEGQEVIDPAPAMQWVGAFYSRADALAIQFAAWSLLFWKGIFVSLALAGVTVAWLDMLDGGVPALCTYYACLASAFLLWLVEWKAERRGRHEDYRALAEALRVQFFWMAAGLRDMASEQYLRNQAGEMVWIRDAMSECGLYNDVLERSAPKGKDRASRYRLAHTWVTGQANYFRKTQRRHEFKKNTLTAIAWFCVAAGLIAPLFGLGRPGDERPHVIAAVAMWWAALTWTYIERRGFVQEARQYARMYSLFHDADEDLNKFEKAENFDAVEETIGELGREALRENADWLTMHRERKLPAHIAAGG